MMVEIQTETDSHNKNQKHYSCVEGLYLILLYNND